MGLDMYAFKSKAKRATLTRKDRDELEEFFYWRKHYELNKWMNELGKKKPVGLYLELEEKDINGLEMEMFAKTLFESKDKRKDHDDEWIIEQDKEFIRRAKEALSEGYRVFYHAD